MAFKLADLKDCKVWRRVELTSAQYFDVQVQIVGSKDYLARINQESDLETAKNFVVGVRGIEGDDGNDITLEAFWQVLDDLPLYVTAATVSQCIQAQIEVPGKNS